MKPYRILLSKVQSLNIGDDIFVLKSQSTPGKVEMACCREDYEAMTLATITDIRSSPNLQHRLDILTTEGNCTDVMKLQQVFFVTPKLVVTVNPNDIDFKGLINKKIIFSDKEEILITFNNEKSILFSNIHDHGVFDILGMPQKFNEKYKIDYQEIKFTDTTIFIPVISIEEKVKEIRINLDKDTPIVFNIPDNIISKFLSKTNFFAEVKKLNTPVWALSYLTFSFLKLACLPEFWSQFV